MSRLSRCQRLTPYIKVLSQMANKCNHLAICLACVEFNGHNYALEHHFRKFKFFKEKYGEDALAIIYKSDNETLKTKAKKRTYSSKK